MRERINEYLVHPTNIFVNKSTTFKIPNEVSSDWILARGEIAEMSSFPLVYSYLKTIDVITKF